MKTTHTNGEWWKYQSDSNISILASKDKKDTHIAQIDNNTKENIANAKLIAAAPELLKALKDCEKLLSIYAESTESSLNNKGADAQIWRNAKQAINKTK